MRSHVAGHGGGVVDQVPDLQDDRGRVDTTPALRALSGLLVDVQQRGPLFGDVDSDAVIKPQPG